MPDFLFYSIHVFLGSILFIIALQQVFTSDMAKEEFYSFLIQPLPFISFFYLLINIFAIQTPSKYLALCQVQERKRLTAVLTLREFTEKWAYRWYPINVQ